MTIFPSIKKATINAASVNAISQSAHFFSGIAVVGFGSFFFGHPDWIIAIWIMFSVIKEFFLDLIFEDDFLQGSPLLDLGIAIFGGVVGDFLHHIVMARGPR